MKNSLFSSSGVRAGVFVRVELVDGVSSQFGREFIAQVVAVSRDFAVPEMVVRRVGSTRDVTVSESDVGALDLVDLEDVEAGVTVTREAYPLPEDIRAHLMLGHGWSLSRVSSVSVEDLLREHNQIHAAALTGSDSLAHFHGLTPDEDRLVDDVFSRRGLR